MNEWHRVNRDGPPVDPDEYLVAYRDPPSVSALYWDGARWLYYMPDGCPDDVTWNVVAWMELPAHPGPGDDAGPGEGV